MGQSMEELNTVTLHTYEGYEEDLMVWAVYSTVPDKELAAAFYERDDAQWLHEQLAESEEPALMRASEVDCFIDEFKELVRYRASLYTVILENGRVSREDTYDDQVFNLHKPAFVPGYPEIFAGTYWAESLGEAIRIAEKLWKEQSRQ